MKHLLRANTNSFSGNSLFIFLIRFFPSLANVLVIIYYARTLSEHDYGVYQNFWTQLFVFSTLACLGLQAFLLTYAPAKLIGIFKAISSHWYFVFAGWILVVGIAFVVCQNLYGNGGLLLPLSFLVVYSLGVISEAILIALRRFSILVIVNTLHSIAFCFFHWFALREQYHIDILFYWLLSIAFIRLCVLAFTVVKDVRGREGVPIISSLREVRSLWIHMGIYDMSQMLFRWIDKFIVSIILTKALFAVYFNGSIDIPFLPLILGAVSSAALMQMSQQQENDNMATIDLLIKKGRVLSSVVFPLFFFFLFFRHELFSVLLSEKYLAAVPVFLVSIMAMPLRAYSFTTVLQNRHKGAVINIGAVADLVIACGLMYPLYMLMGLPGIALAFVISSYLQAAYYLYHSAKTLNTSILKIVPIFNWFIKLLLFSLVFATTHYLINNILKDLSVLILGIVITCIVAFASVLLELRLIRGMHTAKK